MCFLNPWKIHTLFKYFWKKWGSRFDHTDEEQKDILMLRSACAIFSVTKRAKDSWILCMTIQKIKYIYIFN